MSSIREPEVQFAQKLASNERPVRSKALKKLRKYINARSQRESDGFTSDELLKLWKGLFYCLWMQDKPLLQEELSRQISTLIHSFNDTDKQLLYLESFLLTFKREWTGIDRLRMDKFFQLVRFVFRQTFEALKRKSWESSAVSKFLEMLTAQLLQSSSDAPCGLQLHILDLYLTELAAVGSAELTADQNLTFIEPFCKTAAKTKNQTLFSAICRSIFSTIIDQAPFAIEDLMKEVKAAEASEEDGTQIKGDKSTEEEDEDDDEDDLEEDDAELLNEDMGPVLQFDYAALADKLFELARRNSTPGQNRQRLYRIIKVLRDLSEGVFPESEYPEEVSTDEDDEMFGSRRRMKRGRGHAEGPEAPAAKKSKGQKKEALNNQDDDGERTDVPVKDEKKKKTKAKRKAQTPEQGGIVAQAHCETKETEGGLDCSEVAQTQSDTSAVNVPETSAPDVSRETCPAACNDQSGKEKTRDASEDKLEVTETVEVQEICAAAKPEMSCEVPVSGKKGKKKMKGVKAVERTEDDREICEASAEETTTLPNDDATTPAKKKNKDLKAKRKPEEASQMIGPSSETDVTSVRCEDSAEDGTAAKKRNKRSLKADEAQKLEADMHEAEAGSETSQHTTTVPLKKTTKKKSKQEMEINQTLEEPPAADESTVTPLKKIKKQNTKKAVAALEEEGTASNCSQVEDAEKLLFEITMTTPTKKKTRMNKSKRSVDADVPTDEAQLVSSSGKTAKKKKRKIPVTFEFEADELEAAAFSNGVTGEETVAKGTALGSDVGEASTPLSSKKSKKKGRTAQGSASDFITFQSKATVPTPLFCKTKGSSSKKVK